MRTYIVKIVVQTIHTLVIVVEIYIIHYYAELRRPLYITSLRDGYYPSACFHPSTGAGEGHGAID
jgi:hypothetical protein